jgi:formylglycine-generating enzyme required for sulfatase activity
MTVYSSRFRGTALREEVTRSFRPADLAVPWEEVATEPKPLVAVGNRLSHSVSVAPETRFYRVAELPEVTPPGSDYLVIDLSGGPSASSYPVSYLSSVPAGGWSDEYKTTKLVMRRIPAGTFTMGSPEGELGRWSAETQRQVTLTKDYYMGVFEVTQRQWERVMGNWPSRFNDTAYRDSRPVEQVSYYMIRENPNNSAISPNWPQSSQVHVDSFMGRLRAKTGLTTLDLPTEAQWEYACRAGTTTALNSGKNLTNEGSCPNMSEVGRYEYNHPGGWSGSPDVSTDGGTAKVGTYLPNVWGLYDMHGNVWEWCLDWYEDYHAPTTDPVGAASGSLRVERGGSWYYGAGYCRSACRLSLHPSGRYGNRGFRLSRTLP